MDLTKLSPAEKVIAGSGFALLIISFMPWFGLLGGRLNAWDNLLSSLAVVLGIAMVVLVLILRFSTARLPKPPVTWGQLLLILGVATVALVLAQLITGDEARFGLPGGEVSVELERKIGIFLGLAAAGGLAYGGFLKSKEPESASGYLG